MKVVYGHEIDPRGRKVSLISPIQTVHEISCLSFMYHVELVDYLMNPGFIVVYWTSQYTATGAGNLLWQSQPAGQKQVIRK